MNKTYREGLDPMKAYKYMFEGVGFNSKRDLSHAITVSFLSEYGQQLMLNVYERAVANAKMNTSLTDSEAERVVFFGFSTNETKNPSSDLMEIIATVKNDNFVYLDAFRFGVGGSIISLQREKLTDKHLKGGVVEQGLPVELPQHNEDLVASSTAEEAKRDALRGISDDFRVSDR